MTGECAHGRRLATCAAATDEMDILALILLLLLYVYARSREDAWRAVPSTWATRSKTRWKEISPPGGFSNGPTHSFLRTKRHNPLTVRVRFLSLSLFFLLFFAFRSFHAQDIGFLRVPRRVPSWTFSLARDTTDLSEPRVKCHRY